MATLIFIWSNSLYTVDESQLQSRELLEKLEPIIELITGENIDTTNDHWLRKTAHFCEFGLLGTEIALLMLVRGSFGWQGIINCLFAGLLAAVSDESVQIIAGRGSQVQDILLDYSGFITAIAIVSIIYFLVRRGKNRAIAKNI